MGPGSPRWLEPPSIVPATSSTDAAPSKAAFVCTCATPDGSANLMDGHSGRSYAQVVGGRASARSRRRREAVVPRRGENCRWPHRTGRTPERRTFAESCVGGREIRFGGCGCEGEVASWAREAAVAASCARAAEESCARAAEEEAS
jgi:hypothetical protein